MSKFPNILKKFLNYSIFFSKILKIVFKSSSNFLKFFKNFQKFSKVYWELIENILKIT